MCVSARVCVYAFVRVCLCNCVYVHVCVCLCAHVFICVICDQRFQLDMFSCNLIQPLSTAQKLAACLAHNGTCTMQGLERACARIDQV